MNARYGSYGIFGSKKRKELELAAEGITFEPFPIDQIQVEPASNGVVPGVTTPSGQGVSVADLAALSEGIGSATAGIASLVHGGRAPTGLVVTGPTTQSAPPAPPMNTGLVMLGVGAAVFIGLGVAAAVASK